MITRGRWWCRPRVRPTLLVLRALNLGDLLVAVPALRGLRRRYPSHRLLVAWDGATARPDDLALAPPDTPGLRPGATVVHAGARYGSKRWPPERFATVARALAAAGHDVVLTGTAPERVLVETVAAAAGLP